MILALGFKDMKTLICESMMGAKDSSTLMWMVPLLMVSSPAMTFAFFLLRLQEAATMTMAMMVRNLTNMFGLNFIVFLLHKTPCTA